MANLWHLEYIMWFLHYRSNFWVTLSHYMVPYISFSCTVSGSCRAGQKPLPSCTSGLRGLQAAPPHALGTRAGIAAGAQHLQNIAASERGRGEITARMAASRAGFSLARLNTSRREDAKEVRAWMQDTVPSSVVFILSSLQLAPN